MSVTRPLNGVIFRLSYHTIRKIYILNIPKKLDVDDDRASFFAANFKVLAFNDLLLIGFSTNSLRISSDFNAV